MSRSMSPTSRTSIGLASIPSDGAADWMAPNCPIPEAMVGSRRTATRLTPGAICLSTSSHFPLRPYSNMRKPVALPPGRAKFATKPAPTGSMTTANTIGTVRVACSNGATVVVPEPARITSGASATNSTACLRTSSALVPAQRMSICALRPSVQPNSASACSNALMRGLYSGSSAVEAKSTPTRRIRSPCCARAASGHAAAAPPSAASNFRRPMVTVIRPSRARCVKARIPRRERGVFFTFKEGRNSPWGCCTRRDKPTSCAKFKRPHDCEQIQLGDARRGLAHNSSTHLRRCQQAAVSMDGTAPTKGLNDRPQRHLVAGEHRLAELLFQHIDKLEHAQVGAIDENGLHFRSIDPPDQRYDFIEAGGAHACAGTSEVVARHDVEAAGDKKSTFAIGHVARIWRRQRHAHDVQPPQRGNRGRRRRHDRTAYDLMDLDEEGSHRMGPVDK